MKRLLIMTVAAVLMGPVWAASKTVTLAVPGMDCPVCPITVKKALIGVPGVSRAEVNFNQRIARVTFDDARTRVDVQTQATRNAGYPSTLAGTSK